jgi:hypothetical protein
MGGDDYDRDVEHASSSGSFPRGGASSERARTEMGRERADSSTSPLNRTVRSETKSPLTIVFDVTGSNIEFARVVYDKAPMLHGQIEQKGYLDDFDICLSAVGDAVHDRAPLQVNEFAKGIAIDNSLKKIWLERGGGSGIEESYELAAHFFANNCEMPNAETPFIFFIADEKPYDNVKNSEIENVFGAQSLDYPSKDAFAKLFEVYKGNVFLLQNPYGGTEFPRKDVTDEVRQAWENCFGSEHAENIIPIYEEKSVVDIILGVVAIATGERNLETYISDMKSRDQTRARVANVRKSLKGLEEAINSNDYAHPDDTGNDIHHGNEAGAQ